MSGIVETDSGYAGRTLSEIASTLPGATRVFRRNKLDFCCGGKMVLAEAAAAKHLSLPALEAELSSVAAMALPAELPKDTSALIALIETRYHAVHRHELPELVRLARRVEAVHKGHPASPAGLADLLDSLTEELEEHMLKEEQVLFPLMRRGGHPMIAQPIRMMLSEHDDHGEKIRRMEALTGDFIVPAEACSTWRALYGGGRKLVDDLMEHIHIENNVLFPRFLGAA